jgi:transcription antitermination factor NusG
MSPAETLTANAATKYEVGQFVEILEGHYRGRRGLVVETHHQTSTNGYRRVTVSVLAEFGHFRRSDGVTLPNEYVRSHE